VVVYCVRDRTSSLRHPLGEYVDVFVRREDAEQFIEDVRRDEPALAEHLAIAARVLAAGGKN
jgi:hypothetical protein